MLKIISALFIFLVITCAIRVEAENIKKDNKMPDLTDKNNYKSMNFTIKIDHNKRQLLVNDTLLPGDFTGITKILGAPSRIEKKEETQYVEELQTHKAGKFLSYEVKVRIFFYIYDSLGIIFTSEEQDYDDINVKEQIIAKPAMLTIYFNKQREFTHDRSRAYKPKQTFNGKIFINNIMLEQDKPVIPEDSIKKIDYMTEKFELFGTWFGITSFTRIIDSVYTIGVSPWIRIYFNNGKSREVSFMDVRMIK
jgi:hypothetical protein